MSSATVRITPKLFVPVSNRRAFEDVIKQIVDLIRSGRLGEGDALPPERALADRLEVSRATVRFAVATLADVGVLEVRPGRAGGIFVKSSWIPREIAKMTAARLRPADVYALLEARREIEPRVAVLAAQRATRADLDAIAETVDLHERHRSDRQRSTECQRRFHRAMWRAAHNPILEATMIGIMDRLEVALDVLDRSRAERGHARELHRATLAAIRRGSEANILKAMDKHLSYLEEGFREAMETWPALGPQD